MEKVEKKENSTVPMYGVAFSTHLMYNLRITKAVTGKLKTGDAITIVFDPINRHVSFKSKNFEFYQENIVENVEYRVAIMLTRVNMEAEIELMNDA